MKNKHTPAPWYAVNYSGFINIQSTPYYEASNILDEDICKEAEDNGTLIASAPEMLEALQSIIERWEAISETFPLLIDEKAYKEAKHVLNKALGISAGA